MQMDLYLQRAVPLGESLCYLKVLIKEGMFDRSFLLLLVFSHLNRREGDLLFLLLLKP